LVGPLALGLFKTPIEPSPAEGLKTEFDRAMAGDVAAFNAMLQQRKVPNVISN
jgi:hypothetical protein